MSGQDTANTPDQMSGPSNGEVVPDGEPAAIAAILKVVEQKVRNSAAANGGFARRDAHPKAHGLVRATFTIPNDLPDLPDRPRVGLFATPATYNAWIRFSNGSPTLQSDDKGDGRGMAIKLMGVPGSASGTQDFIMINHPVFAARNVADYLDLENANRLWRFFVPDLDPFHVRVHEALIAGAILAKKVNNLLNTRYWSMSPFRFGDSACKFSVRPAGPPSPFEDTSDPNFLRVNLARHLAERDAAFDFMVQLREKPDQMPVEDATVEWNESDAPYHPVARITIPKQTFDTKAQMDYGENLSFSPWHCLAAHRPLGGLNRLRRQVYETISRVRHELNHVPREEPVDFSMT